MFRLSLTPYHMAFKNVFMFWKLRKALRRKALLAFFTATWFSEMTILLGFQGLKFSRNDISFFQERNSMLSRKQPWSIVASRAKVVPFALCLLGSNAPKPLFTSASAVVVMRISEIRHRGWHRVHRSGDLLVWHVGYHLVRCPVPEFRSYIGCASGPWASVSVR